LSGGEALPTGENIHASAVVVGEAGIVIRGRSGRGKSALALALISAASERGFFGRLIGDDRVVAHRHGDKVLITGASAIRSLIERRGLGLVAVDFEPVAVGRFIVDLLNAGETAPRMPETQEASAALLGVKLPRLAFDDSSRPPERARAILFAIFDLATATTSL
jgi:serine kinase of HPr protein (carbohydrate metabolism regulator)